MAKVRTAAEEWRRETSQGTQQKVLGDNGGDGCMLEEGVESGDVYESVHSGDSFLWK